MALSSKEQKLSQSFKERLEKLSCPFTDGVDESWIVELLFRPGEPRIRLLQWLFSRFDSKLNEMLDPQYVLSDSKMDSRLQRILFVASTIGLCTPEDADLIRGTVSVSKQTSFMDQLIDLVCIQDAAADPQTKALQSPGMVSSAMDLDEQFANDCNFVDVLASQEKMDSLFMQQAKLLPPDLLKNIEMNLLERGYKEIDKVPSPDIGKRVEAAKEFYKDLERQNEILTELNKHYAFNKPDTQHMTKVNRTLRLVLSELSQLLVGFSYCFENELRPWCNKTKPQMTDLGPTVKRVHNLLQQFTMLLSSVGSIRGSYSHICGQMQEELVKISDQMTVSKSGGDAAHQFESFRQCVDVLQESLLREDSTANNTLNSTMASAVINMK